MPEPDEPPPPQPDPSLPTNLGGIDPGELLARGMQSARMSGGGAHGWLPPTPEEVAHLFPNYEILSMLGRGGMGAVYKARQTALDRLVAIKLLPLEISVDQAFADRFRREARAMAKLNHPHIISVHDFGQTSEGHLFFAMEFVEGANLHDIIHGPGLAPEQALAIAAQICTALAYAHGKGVVHRDIKPANVMLDTDSQVKVADFGLARLTDNSAADFGHTMTGTVMGTPDYMAPEQMKGMNVDHRADIYSLGVMLYEMLCRETPRGAFDLPSARTGCDPRLDSIVLKAMQQAPERRYQSTHEMKADVETARTPLPASPPPTEAPRPLAKARPPAPKIASTPASAKKSRALLWIASVVALALALGAIRLLPTYRGKVKGRGTQDSLLEPHAPTSPKYALEFDGKNSYVEIADFPDIPTEPKTIECYAKATKNDVLAALIRLYSQPGLSLYQNRRVWGAGVFQTSGQTYQTSSGLLLGEWVHLASVWNKGHITWFVNGRRVQANDEKMGRVGDRSSRLFLGGQLDDETESKPAYLWTGLLREVRISKSIRYKNNFTPQARFDPDGETVALYHFDEGSGELLKDASGNHHDGKINGAKWVRLNGEVAEGPSAKSGPPATATNAAPFVNTLGAKSVPTPDTGWISLFDGKSLDGWKASQKPGAFSVQDGKLVVHGNFSHLFYDGPVQQHDFKNFELKADIMTKKGANSGLYFHTEFQQEGFPQKGFEVQVNNTQSDPKKTAGLYNIEDNFTAPAQDDEWFTMTIRVEGRRVITKVNEKVIIDWIEPDPAVPPAAHQGRIIAHGTFAIQAHDPGSEVHYKNIFVRPLP